MERRLAAILVADIAGYSALFLRMEIIALAHLGRIDEAREACRRHMAAAPGLRISHYSDAASKLGVFMAASLRGPMIEGLRLAGMPQ